MSFSSSSSPALSSSSTKFGLESSSMSVEDSKSLRRRAIERVRHAATSQDILLFLIAFRILNALSIKTFFQPDEFFQSLEPAWEIAFGANSGAWITWEWKNQLRSSIHPVLFAVVYKLAALLSGILHLPPLWHADLMIAAPKVTQAVFAALGDYYTWKLAEQVYGQSSNEAWTTLALTVFSPWQWFYSTRTFSNCLETTLTIAALNFWPWQWSMAPQDDEDVSEDSIRQKAGHDQSEEMGMSAIGFWDQVMHLADLQWGLRRCLVLAAFAVILRPTNILIWICLACFTLFRVITYGKMVEIPWLRTPFWIHISDLTLYPATMSERHMLVREGIICGTLVLLLTALSDRLYYGFYTLPPLRFLYFNLVQSLAVFYGRNRWDYYFTEGLPLLLTTALPFALAGLSRALFPDHHQPPHRSPTTTSILNQLATTTLLVPTFLSLIAHKEVRFITPLLPPLLILAAPPLRAFFTPAFHPAPGTRILSARRLLLAILSTLTVALALLSTTSHQPAPIAVLDYLRHEHASLYLSQPPPPSLSNVNQIHPNPNPTPNPHNTHQNKDPSPPVAALVLPPAPSTMTLAFLTPCHSTPWRSHLIFPSIKAWALSCEPPVNLNASQRASYVDEADVFYADPKRWLATELGPPPLPPRAVGGGGGGWFGSEKGYGREDLLALDAPPSPLQPEQIAWDGRQGKKVWPEYLVFFGQLEPVMKEVLGVGADQRGGSWWWWWWLGRSVGRGWNGGGGERGGAGAYGECWRGWNGWGHEDWRRRGGVVVWCLRGRGGR